MSFVFWILRRENLDFYEILFIIKLLNHGFVGLWDWVLKVFVYIFSI